MEEEGGVEKDALMNFSEVKLSSVEEAKQTDLIEICRKYKGSYIPGHHPDTTFCRQYHPEFVAAVRVLYTLYFDVSKRVCLSYYNLETLPPTPMAECERNALSNLEVIFRDYGIFACQGGNLAGQKLKYILGSMVNGVGVT